MKTTSAQLVREHYFVPQPSLYPVILSGSMFLLALGFIQLINGYSRGQWVMLGGVAVIIYVLAIVVVQSITTARIQNTVWNTTRLGSHGFISEISWFKLFGITLTNLVATVLTIGLFRPFAQVRLARYLASAVVMVPSGPLDNLLAAETEDVSAVGEETVGFFDLDVGF